MGSIRGFVMDEYGRPVENATIAAPQIGDFALSHQDGSFEITDMPNGSYIFHIIQRHYHPYSFTLDVYTDMVVRGIALKLMGGDPEYSEKVSILEVKKGVEDALLQIPGVVGIGIDRVLGALRVYTTNCEPKLLAKIPSQIAGFKISVVCTGRIKSIADTYAPPPPSRDYPPRAEYRIKRYRPVVGGISASHESVNAGTLGAVLRNRAGEKVLLSNTHVFANRDMVGSPPRAQHGDQIVQPGPYDSGRLVPMGISDNVVGHLSDWIKLDPYNNNIVDCAVATPVDQDECREYVLANDEYKLIRVAGTRPVTSPILVKKYGRTTDVTSGRVIDWDASVVVTYQGIPVKFTDQLIVEMDSNPGDSGSLIMDEKNYAIGLLYGGAAQPDDRGVLKEHVFANKIGNVLAMLDLKFGGMDSLPPWSPGLATY